MRAITVLPGQANSGALTEMPEPPESDGPVLVTTQAIGVCGTDAEILSGSYGAAPPGAERLIIGHESLGRVASAPEGSGFAPGDLVVGVVRRPDPVPCVACGAGEWDMCRNGRYTERGIKGRHGYAAERFRIEPQFLVKLDPALGDLGVLLEPTSIVAKAWEHVRAIGLRSRWAPRRVLVTGAGPIGLLAALMGRQWGLEVHVLDRAQGGPKPELVQALGGSFHRDLDGIGFAPDVVMECTGAATLIEGATMRLAPGGICCLAGISGGPQSVPVDLGTLDRNMVLGNQVLFGSVNANLRHYRAAAEALTKADRTWLARLITRREPVANWQAALQRRPGDIKVVVDFTL